MLEAILSLEKVSKVGNSFSVEAVPANDQILELNLFVLKKCFNENFSSTCTKSAIRNIKNL